MVLGEAGLRIAGRLSLRRVARTIGAILASLVVVAGTITAFGAAVVSLGGAPAAAAPTCNDNWTGADSATPTNWNDALNWSPAGVPASGADVCIPTNATVVDSNVSPSLDSLDVAQGATLTIGTATGTNGLNLLVNGPTTVEGSLVLGVSGTSFTSMIVDGTGLTISSTGNVTEAGTMTLGNNGSSPALTNDGTMTVGSSGVINFAGASSMTNGGMLTDNNSALDSISLTTGGLTITGGTICGTAPSLNSTPLTFSGTPVAGPNCTSGTQDQIQARTGTEVLTGNIPTGYTFVDNATVSTTTSVINNGELQLADGELIVGTGTTFTNSGSFDTTSANGILDGSTTTGSAFTTSSSGSFTVEGTLTIANNGSSPAVTNDGTMTVGSSGVINFAGASSMTNGGMLTDNNSAPDSISLTGGGLTITGGTICGTAPSLNSTPLTFSGTPVAGPDCPAGVAEDVIQARTGTEVLTGNIPTGYSLVDNATVSTTTSVINNGELQLADGELIVGTGTTFTNSGSFDTTSANGILDGSTTTGSAFTTSSSGSFTVEGTLTIANNGSSPAVTNDGTMTVGSSGVINFAGASSMTNGGMLTDNNSALDSISLTTGGLTITGGTICGTAPSLNSTPLTFSGTPVAGPNCTSGTQDQIQARTGTEVLTGNIPTGYTFVDNATVSTTTSVINNGELQLADGELIVGTGTTFTNSGSFDTTSANGILDGSTTTGSAFTTSSSGSFTVEGTLTIANNGSSPAVTNDGTMTVGSSGVINFAGASSMTNGGMLTDNNSAPDSISLTGGGLTITGGTICGTAPSLNSTPLTFSGTPVAGPDCPAGVAEDVIQARTGTEVLTGNIPTGYSLVDNAVVSTSSSVTNDGSLVLAGGELIISATSTFTNSGSFDTTSANGILDANTASGGTFVNGSGGNWTIEGTLTVGNNGSAPALTNSGLLGIAPGAELTLVSSITLTNTSSGTVAFGIDGVNTSSSNYGEINGKTNLQGGTLDPVDDNGYTPSSGTEYFVMLGTNTGTFTSVLHNATADYSHNNETGVIGGAPATPTTTTVTSTANPAVYGQPVSLTATVSTSSGTPTGSVTFYAGSTAIGTQSVSTSNSTTTASIEVSSLRVGSDSITAVYSGNAVFNASTSAVLTQVVNLDPSHVSIVPSPPSPVPGQQETYTVEVSATSPGAGTPSGDVSLTDNGNPVTGCQNLVMGPLGPSFVTCSVTYPAIGAHTIGASYAGDTDFTNGNGSQPVSVQPASTSTALVSSANPGPLGAPVTYTATVSVLLPGSGTPTGSVSFTDNSSAVSDCQALTLPQSAPFQVTCTETYGTNANHSIVATYSGDTNDATSTNSLTETLQQVGTNTTVGGPSASTYGQAVTYTATVSPSQTASANPSGTVTFEDDGSTQVGVASVSTTAGITTATLTTSSLGAGDHSITATYNGDQTFTPSTSGTPALLDVSQAATSLTVASSANPSVVGQTVTFTGTLASSATGETGTIEFADNGVNIGSGSVSGGQATFSTSSLALGGHPITAAYNGDANFVDSVSTNTVSQPVSQAATSTGVGSSANPGSVGSAITYTATVTVNGPGSGLPTGHVSFSDGGNPIAICQNLLLPSSSPPSVTCAQMYSTTTPHNITATYGGDTNFVGSSGGLTESLSSVGTTTSVGAAPSTATFGQPVTLTATVAPTSGGANPTGSVAFTDNGTTALGSSTLSTTNGVTTASILVTTLPVGPDSISASYGGGAGFVASASTTSAPVSVSMSPTTLGLISAPNPSTFGQSVTFTATIFPTTGSGETGTVTFLDNGNSIGTGIVSNGQATFTTTALAVAAHPITASYGGDGNFVHSSTTTGVSQVVNKASTSLTLQSSLNPSTSGQSVTLTATVTPTTGTGETGTVTFLDNGNSIGNGSVSAGQATLTTTTLSAGSHPITASYAGDGNFVSSSTTSTLNQVVNSGAVATTITLSSSVNPSTVGQTVSLTAAVAPVGGGSPNFTGTVTFSEGTTVVGMSPVTASGLSTVSLPQLAGTSAIGTHTFTASYSGGGNYLGSTTTSPFSQVVAPPIFITSSDGGNFGIANSANDSYRTVLTSSSNGCFCAAENFLAVTPDGTRAYDMHPTSTNTTITAVNTATGSVMASISLPYRAADLTMAPNGANLYVAESVPGNEVAVINTATNTVTKNIPVSVANGEPQAMAINAAGTELAVAEESAVDMVNLTTSGVTTVALNGAEGVTFSPNGATAYVTNGYLGGGGFGANTVSAISTATNTITRTYSGMTEPIAVAVTPDGTQLFVANVGTYNSGGGHYVTTPYVAAINTSSGTETNYMQSTIPENVSVSPDGKSVYIADSASGQVGIWNAATHAQVGTIAVAGQPDTVKPFGDTAPPPPPPPPPLNVTTTTLPGAAQSVYYSSPLAATGGQSPYSWSLSGGTLPAGLGLTPSGSITGTPSATATTSTFTVKVTDSEYPASTATATLTLLVAPASAAPPPCGGSGMGGYSPIKVPPNCVTASNTVTGGTASATSTSSAGTIAVTAHGTGGFTIGQTGTAPPDVPFRAATDAFDLDLSSSNTFTSITVVDCALNGATSLQWWNAAANGGVGAWETVSPAVYNHITRCLTITFSSASSPTIAQLDGTTFAGVLPVETVTITTGGASPYSITGSVLSGAITITQGQLITQVSGTVLLSGASGEVVTATINTSCILGVCAGTFSVSDPQAGVSFTTPLTATLGQISAAAASGEGLVFPGPGLKNSYPLSWSVTVATS